MESISEGLVKVDPELNLIYFNQSFARMLGYAPEDLGKMRSIDLVA